MVTATTAFSHAVFFPLIFSAESCQVFRKNFISSQTPGSKILPPDDSTNVYNNIYPPWTVLISGIVLPSEPDYKINWKIF